MAGDDAVHHRQPETRAVTDPFGREKGLEDAISGGPIHKPSLARREQLLRIGPKADGNLADSAADRVGGVGHEVHNRLMQLAGITEKRGDLRNLLNNLDRRRQARPQHLQSLARHPGEIDLLFDEILLAAESEELPEENLVRSRCVMCSPAYRRARPGKRRWLAGCSSVGR
jgi:hypothetical protein